jgi:hypothetical protein
MTDDNSIARCHECKRPLTVIDYYCEHLTGCMTCNLWGPPGKGRLGSARAFILSSFAESESNHRVLRLFD